MTILVAASFDADEWRVWQEALEAALPNERLARERSEAGDGDIDIALVANPPPGALQGLPGLKLIQSLWAGVDRLLADPSVPTDVPLARMVDPMMNATMAETALWAVLSLQRGFFGYAAQQRDGVWRQHPLRRAADFNVSVLGLGQMGQRAAEALIHQGYRVTGWSARDGAEALPQALARADAVVNLLPLTPATRGLFNAATLALLPRGAGLVNLARGEHVVEADLLAALDDGRICHAVLDVFETEPLPSSSALWKHPRVTITPHNAADSDPDEISRYVADQIAAFERGEPLRNVVDLSRGY